MTDGTDPAAARKRRKEIMATLRADKEVAAAVEVAAVETIEHMDDDEEDFSAVSESLPPKKRKVVSKKKNPPQPEPDEDEEDSESDDKKTQIRYDPEVPMSKEQLAAWRREARRVRNRESAAASRQRIRDRITELEDEVGDWKTKYLQAMQRLDKLQKDG